MNEELEIFWGEQTLIFHSYRAIYFPEKDALLISDLHLGKSGHFRKYGIPIPQAVAQNDLDRLNHILQQYSPKKLIIAGDFFHAEKNIEIELFKQWFKAQDDFELILIKGNHDKLSHKIYSSIGFTSVLDMLKLGKITISHDILPENEGYQITGHIHPGVILKNKLKQNMRIPVFAHHEKHIILPAFSKFTGLYTRWENTQYQFIGCTEVGLITL